MSNYRLRQHYLKTKNYIEKNPKDLQAMESFQNFLSSCRYASLEIHREVTNPSLTEMEMMYLKELNYKKIEKPKRDKYLDWDEEEEFWEDSYGR